MQIKDILKKHKDKLPLQELDDLLALALHKTKNYIYKHPDKELSRSNILAFNKLINKRLANWPMAYLRAHQEFYGLKFLINKNVLIPRPDSEVLVEQTLKYLKNKNNLNIIDIGTGSGCLIISVAKNAANNNYYAADISTKALKIAKTNARKNKVNIKFLKSDLLKNINNKKFDVIIANLPYLNPKQLKESSIQKEPSLALAAGKDGLDYYKKLLNQISKYLNKKYLVLLEIDPEQKNNLEKLIKKNLPQGKLEFIKDLSNNTRVARITN